MRPAPGKRFLFLAGMLMPLGLLVIVYDGFSLLFWPAFLLLFVVAIADLSVSEKQLQGVVVAPDPVTRLARDVAGKFLIHVRCESNPPKEISIGLPLPVEFSLEEEIQNVLLTGKDASHWTLSWSITARSRGVFYCRRIFVEVPSAWGLFNIRQRYDVESEIRVYPNMRRERRQLANLFLNRGSIGAHAQRTVGQGREYEQLREYCAGDSMLDIHWKASAKRGALVTKTYQVERTQEIYLIIDHSRLSGINTRRKHADDESFARESILERYVTAASVLSLVAEREGDLFGLVTFAKEVSCFVRASNGKQHGQVIQNALFNLKTERGPFDLDELFTFLRLRLRRRALLIFLTDLSDVAAAEEFSRNMRVVAGHHYVLVNSIRREGIHPLYQGDIDENISLSDEIAGHLRWEGLRRLQTRLRADGVEFSILDDEKLSLELVNQYLALKQRQVL